MNCQICDQEEAAFTVIPTGPGDPQSLGVVCFARSGLELAKTVLPAEEIAQTLGPMFVHPPTPDEVANASPPAKPRARKARAQAAAPEAKVEE